MRRLDCSAYILLPALNWSHQMSTTLFLLIVGSLDCCWFGTLPQGLGLSHTDTLVLRWGTTSASTTCATAAVTTITSSDVQAMSTSRFDFAGWDTSSMLIGTASTATLFMAAATGWLLCITTCAVSTTQIGLILIILAGVKHSIRRASTRGVSLSRSRLPLYTLLFFLHRCFTLFGKVCYRMIEDDQVRVTSIQLARYLSEANHKGLLVGRSIKNISLPELGW